MIFGAQGRTNSASLTQDQRKIIAGRLTAYLVEVDRGDLVQRVDLLIRQRASRLRTGRLR